MSDNVALVLLAIPSTIFVLLMIFGEDFLKHRRQVKQIEVDRIREQRLLLEAERNAQRLHDH